MLTVSHFSAVLLFATFASVVFVITQRTSPKAMVRYGLYCWAMFIGIVIAASWVMWFIRR